MVVRFCTAECPRSTASMLTHVSRARACVCVHVFLLSYGQDHDDNGDADDTHRSLLPVIAVQNGSLFAYAFVQTKSAWNA